MSNIEGFNAADVDPSEGFDVLPVGEYRAIIVESEIAASKQEGSRAQMLKATFQILDGPFQNRKFWLRQTFANRDGGKNKIGHGWLSSICRAVGVLTPRDTSDLHNRPLIAKLKVKEDKDQDGNPRIGNEVTSIKAATKSQPRQQQPAQTTSHTASAADFAQSNASPEDDPNIPF